MRHSRGKLNYRRLAYAIVTMVVILVILIPVIHTSIEGFVFGILAAATIGYGAYYGFPPADD